LLIRNKKFDFRLIIEGICVMYEEIFSFYYISFHNFVVLDWVLIYKINSIFYCIILLLNFERI